MEKFICISVALMTMFVTGESLVCHTCKVGIGGRCLFRSTETCCDTQPNCYRGKLAFNLSGMTCLDIQGCLPTDLCNQTRSGALLTGLGYSMRTICCNTDGCNGATSIQFSLTAALGAAILAVWSSRSL